MTAYTDIDYYSIPVPNHHAGRPWTQLPAAQWKALCDARRRADEEELKQKHPDHRLILVKSHPTFSPPQDHLWPLINDAIIRVLEHHEDVFDEVSQAVTDTVNAHRGWRNPHPADLDTPDHLVDPAFKKKYKN